MLNTTTTAATHCTTFNVVPLLKLVDHVSAPELACYLETAIGQLTNYALSGDECQHQEIKESLYFMRLLRNSILEGGNIIKF